jgi:DNA-binding CsgD family transcriptional regulator
VPSPARDIAAYLLSAAISLSDAETLADTQRGASSLLSSLIDCDDVLWTEIDVSTSSAIVRRGPSLMPDADLSRALGRYGSGHPAVLSYISPTDDRRPRRVSDVVPQHEWGSSPVYCEVFRADRARFQLSLVLELAGGIGRGWVLTRSSTDFADGDVDTARLALPLLIALHRLAATKPAKPSVSTEAGVLTDRELQVLRLVATGMTATAIGRATGIAEATVRKHSEHIYRKLERRDRLTAVLRARELGLLGPGLR